MNKNKLKNELLDYLKSFIFSVIVFILLINFVMIPVKVDGTSMYPTLHPDDRGFSSIFNLKNAEIHRFDIVTINFPDKILVKRVIGLPNDLVEYYGEDLYINGEYVAEDFLDQEYVDEVIRQNGYFTQDFKYQLKEGEYFLLGDNRNNSRDSRYYGPFERDRIYSKGIFVFWPLSDFGIKH